MSARERARTAGGVGRWIVVVAFALGLTGLVLASLPGGAAHAPRSALSREETGRLFAYRLLQALDFPVRIWSEAPGELPRGRALVWLPETPPETPEYLQRIWDREREDPAEPAPQAAGAAVEPERVRPTRSSGRERDPRHYRRFVEEGGVLLSGIADGRRDFLEGVLGIEAVARLEAVLAPDGAGDERGRRRTTVAAFGGEPFRILPAYRSPWRDFGASSVASESVEWIEDPDRIATPLIADPDEPRRAVAWRVPVGRGEVVVLTQDELFANHAITDDDNGLYLVRLFEAIGPVDEILFDEYALGARVHPTRLELALAPGRAPITLHLVLALLLWLWWLAATRAFPREPSETAGVSPVARAEAFGATLARLGRFDALGEMLRRGVLARFPGARRVRPAAGEAPEAEPDDALDVEAALSSVAHLARDADELERWRAALRATPVRSAAELADLARRLRPVEDAVAQRLRRASARRSAPSLANRGSELQNPDGSRTPNRR